jgi:tetratricopeptide (TPR) repeat protein
LFVARAQAAVPGFSVTDETRAHITRVCRAVSGLPLALELAAARTTAFTPEQLMERLGEGIDVLSEGSTPERRHRTMRSALEWSYRLLDDRLARLFRRLAVFRGGLLIEDAQYVAGERDEVTADDVASLVDKSLVERTPGMDGRYRLLEPVREFARELLEESDESELIRARHAIRYLAVARQADRGLRGPGQLDWLKRMRADHDNLRAAMDWGLFNRPDTALELVAASAWFWFMAGYWRDAWTWFQRALDAGGEDHPTLRAKAVYTAGGLQVIRVNPVPVYSLIEEAVEDCRAAGDRFGEAWCLHLMGHADLRLPGERVTPEQRMRLLVDTREMFDELDRPWEVAWSDRYIGDALAVDGKVREGVEQQIRSISAFREMGDSWSTAYGLHNVANAMLVLASPDYGPETARSYFQRCLRISENLGDQVRTAHALRGLATCSYLLGSEDAEALFGDAEERLRLIGDESCLSAAVGFLGDLRRKAGDWSTAGAYYGEALRLRHKLASKMGMAQNLDRLALLALDTGQEDLAGRLAASADRAVANWGDVYPSYYREKHAEVMARVGIDDPGTDLESGADLEDVVPLALELAEAISAET